MSAGLLAGKRPATAKVLHMKKNEAFPSRYLKASDLNGKPITMTIESVATEPLRSDDGKVEDKTVLHFKGAKKVMTVNLTNWDAIVAATGEDDSDKWPGHRIELYPTTTAMKNKTVPCIRIRPPAQRELPAAADDMGDAIPF